MPIECYQTSCPYHGIYFGEEGPFCFEEKCKQKGCYQCRFYLEWTEKHPYGSTTASETLCECDNPAMPEEVFDTMELPIDNCPYMEPNK